MLQLPLTPQHAARVLMAARLLAFREDQPRDDHGRWTDGGSVDADTASARLDQLLTEDRAEMASVAGAGARDAVSIERVYGHPLEEIWPQRGKSFQVEQVDLTALHPTQRVGTRDTIRAFIRNPKLLGDDARRLPVVIRTRDGRHVVRDGHNRLAAAILRGEKRAPVALYDEVPRALEFPLPTHRADRLLARAVVRVRAAANFDRDQLRDEAGRWTSGDVVYHGSTQDFDAFDLSKAGTVTDEGWLGRGVYFSTDARVAGSYPIAYDTQVKLNNPLRLTAQSFRDGKKDLVRDALQLPRDASVDAVTTALKERGHDGVVLDYTPTGYKSFEIMALDPAATRIVKKYETGNTKMWDDRAFGRPAKYRRSLSEMISLRAATFDPDQPRDDHGRWTDGGDVNLNAARARLPLDADGVLRWQTAADGSTSVAGIHENRWTDWAHESDNINDLLAGETVDYGSYGEQLDDATRANLKQTGELIQAAAETHAVRGELWRGEQYASLAEVEARYTRNQTVTFDRLTAGATRADIAVQYAEGDKYGDKNTIPVVLRIQRNGGTLGIQTIPNTGVLSGEVVMPRGESFRVSGVIRPGNDRYSPAVRENLGIPANAVVVELYNKTPAPPSVQRYTPWSPKKRDLRTAARAANTPLHRAAAQHVKPFAVAIRYAFAEARRTLRPALVGLRTAAFDPDQPRDEHGRWTDDGDLDTSSPEFQSWFKESKIVDDHGEPLVVLHGTPRRFEQFDPIHGGNTATTQTGAANGVLGHFFTTNASTAEMYAGRRGEVIEAYLNIKKPLRLMGKEFAVDASEAVNTATAEFHDFPKRDLTEDDFREWKDYLTRQGYDGIVVKLHGKSGSDFIAFSPQQIRSAYRDQTFRGAAFNPDQPRDEHGQWTDTGAGHPPATLTGVQIREGARHRVRIESDQGFITLLRTDDPAGQEVLVGDIEVKEGMRRRGFGRALYEKALDYALSKGAKALTSTGALSADAKRMWARFESEGRAGRNDDGDRVLLPRKLRGAAFNPDQPRDEQGQWTDAGGGSAERAVDQLKSVTATVVDSNTDPATSDADRALNPLVPGYAHIDDELDIDELTDVVMEEVADKYDGDTIMAMTEAAKDSIGVIQEIDIDNIDSAQTTVSRDIVRKYIRSRGWEEEAGIGIKEGQNVLLVDGNHRVSALKLRGDKKARIRIVNLRTAAFDPDQPRDEYGRWTGVGYHGSPKQGVTEVSATPTERQYDNATSQFGAFFADNVVDAKHYAGEKGALYQAKLALDKPYNMSWREFSYFQDITKDSEGKPVADWAGRMRELTDEARALRQRLEAEGHDGIIVRSARGVIKEIATFKNQAVVPHTLAARSVNIDPSLFALRRALHKTLRPALHRALVAGGDVGWAGLKQRRAAEFTVAARKQKFDPENPEAVAWAREHAAELVDQIEDTTRDRIRRAVANLTAGGDWNEGVEKILAAVGDEDRAELIARHEVQTAVSVGQRQAWDQAVDEGILTGREQRVWRAIGPNPCPQCVDLDGETAALDGEYDDDVPGPPAHVGCYCVEEIIA